MHRLMPVALITGDHPVTARAIARQLGFSLERMQAEEARRTAEAAILKVPDTHFHDYEKSARPGRKLGHVTAVGDDTALAGIRRLVAQAQESRSRAGTSSRIRASAPARAPGSGMLSQAIRVPSAASAKCTCRPGRADRTRNADQNIDAGGCSDAIRWTSGSGGA